MTSFLQRNQVFPISIMDAAEVQQCFHNINTAEVQQCFHNGNVKDLVSLVQVRLLLRVFPSFFFCTNKSCFG